MSEGDDVLALAEHFLREYGAKYGRDVRSINSRAREALLSYSWPGNVRELSHVIERAVLWSRGPELDVEQLSLTAPSQTASSMPDASSNSAVTPQPSSNIPAEGGDLPGWEKAMIEQALRESSGNQTKAALRLGISRDTLRYRLKKFGIQ